MGERLLKANGRNHDEKSVGNTYLGTETDNHPAPNQLVLSSLLAMPDEWCKWFKENPPRNEQDKGAPNQQPSNQQIPSIEEEDWEDTRPRSRMNGQMTAALLRECKRECTIPVAPRNMQREMRNNPESTTRANLDPPDLVEENVELERQLISSTRSTSMERHEKVKAYNSMTDEGYRKATRQTQKQKQYVQRSLDSYIKRKKFEGKSASSTIDDKNDTENEMVDLFTGELAIIEMIRSRSEKTQYIQQHIDSCLELMKNEVMRKDITKINNFTEKGDMITTIENAIIKKIENKNKIEEMVCNNHVRDSNTTLRLICNRLYMVKRIGAAIELVALLRRCLYPKRDVIRWSL
eukprot:scaffold86042_cov80-Cyclotella_meneghiniana.AAC.1